MSTTRWICKHLLITQSNNSDNELTTAVCNDVQEPHKHYVGKSSQIQRTHTIWIHFYTLKSFDIKIKQQCPWMSIYLVKF